MCVESTCGLERKTGVRAATRRGPQPMRGAALNASGSSQSRRNAQRTGIFVFCSTIGCATQSGPSPVPKMGSSPYNEAGRRMSQ